MTQRTEESEAGTNSAKQFSTQNLRFEALNKLDLAVVATQLVKRLLQTRGPRFKSSHGQNLQMLSTIFEKTKIMEKRPGEAQFLKKKLMYGLNLSV